MKLRLMLHSELESSHEHASSEDAAHTDHECEYCLVYSFALPLFETKLRYNVNPNANSDFVF